MVKLVFPKTIEVEQDASIFTELIELNYDYSLTGTLKGDVFVDWRWEGNGDSLTSSGTMDSETLTLGALKFGTTAADININGSSSEESFGTRLLEIVAHKLFSNAKVTAPIANDSELIATTGTVTKDVVDQFNSDESVRVSLVKQLMSSDAAEFSDNAGSVTLTKGDVLVVIVNYKGNSVSEEASQTGTYLNKDLSTRIGIELTYDDDSA